MLLLDLSLYLISRCLQRNDHIQALCLWDTPDKNLGVGCHSLLKGDVYAEVNHLLNIGNIFQGPLVSGHYIHSIQKRNLPLENCGGYIWKYHLHLVLLLHICY